MKVTDISERCTIVNADAFEFMALLPDNFVDVTIGDPPYSEHTHANLGKEQRDDGTGPRADLTFTHFTIADIETSAKEIVRATKGWIHIFTDDRSVGDWGRAFERFGARWIRTCSWIKTTPMPQMTGDRPGSGQEFIVSAFAGNKLAWNGKGRSGVMRGPRDQRPYHATQKPTWLMQELAMLYATPGALIMDPFMGSGSTGVGALFPTQVQGLTDVCSAGCPKCQQTLAKHIDGRPALIPDLRFLGIERDPEVFSLADSRLRLALQGKLHADP